MRLWRKQSREPKALGRSDGRSVFYVRTTWERGEMYWWDSHRATFHKEIHDQICQKQLNNYGWRQTRRPEGEKDLDKRKYSKMPECWQYEKSKEGLNGRAVLPGCNRWTGAVTRVRKQRSSKRQVNEKREWGYYRANEKESKEQ